MTFLYANDQKRLFIHELSQNVFLTKRFLTFLYAYDQKCYDMRVLLSQSVVNTVYWIHSVKVFWVLVKGLFTMVVSCINLILVQCKQVRPCVLFFAYRSTVRVFMSKHNFLNISIHFLKNCNTQRKSYGKYLKILQNFC